MQYTLSIIMVPFRAKEVFRKALLSLEVSKTDFLFEVIVIDNNSADGTVEMVRNEFQTKEVWKDRLVLFENTNEGFPKGNNRGIKMKRGEWVLLLNPDTEVEPNTLQVMYDFMQSRKDVGVATCKLIKADGTLDKACRRSVPTPWVAFARLSGLSKLFPNNKTFAKYNLEYKSIDEETEVDACVGAFMFISPECMQKVGLLDESFYMYGEDLDYCMRVKEAGFKVWYYPKTTTIHYKGQSSKKTPAKALYAFHEAMWIFYKKFFRKKYLYLLDPFVYTGIWARYFWKRLLNSFRSNPYVSK